MASAREIRLPSSAVRLKSGKALPTAGARAGPASAAKERAARSSQLKGLGAARSERISTLEDLGSKNGTYLRGKRIQEPTALANGDEICVGPVLMTFHTARSSGSTETDGIGRKGGPFPPSRAGRR